MKWISALAAVAFVGLTPLEARAAKTITFDNGFPKQTAAGKITGTGDYTLDTGDDLISITLFATPVGGGLGATATCMVDEINKTWTGSVGGLAKGKYRVFAKMTVGVAGGGTQDIFTNTVEVEVK